MRVELLAPAGSYESMMAAYKAGADAVYLGGTRFGARAFADNLDTERMKEAIDYAHLRGKKLYLTVNTLLKQKEIEEVYDYLLPFYKEGLDAVIVQDFGVFQMVKESFPGMDLHASTQMTVTGVKGAQWLFERGASRVVTARELSLEEIQKIHEQVPVEIESFVHGALCFCYSGQCLLSSMIGGRSGNRGRCAQPCRLPYQLYENGKKISKDDHPYLMSPKDMCTLDIIPELIESGIYSFKMEGRMKKPEYTAGITAIYRKYIDRYLEYGQQKYQVSSEDRSSLMDLYNRGGFSLGYYRQHNGREMMSMERPNHWGTEAAKAVVSEKNVKWKALEDLHAQDVLELREKKEACPEITLTQHVKSGSVFSLKTGRIKVNKSSVLYRTRNAELLGRIKKEYMDTPYKVPVEGELTLKKDMPIKLKATCGKCSVLVTGKEAEAAQKRPSTEDEVRRQISKLGQTDFQWSNLKIQMDEQIFVPVQELNELRRNMADTLKKELLEVYVRKEPSAQKKITIVEGKKEKNIPELTAEIQTSEQLRAILFFDEIKRVYINSLRYDSKESFLMQAEKDIAKCHEKEKDCWYVMPWIFREEKRNYFRQGKEVQETLKHFDGILVKNLEEIEYLQKIEYGGKIALDQNMYIWNQEALKFWEQESIEWMTLPVELTEQEMKALNFAKKELIVYGYTPLMVTAQCFQKNTTGCSKTRKVLQLHDRKNKHFFIKNDCSFCYNILYNSAVTDLADLGKTVRLIAPESVRLSFTTESTEQVKAVLERYIKAFIKWEDVKNPEGDFTRGHMKRGVE